MFRHDLYLRLLLAATLVFALPAARAQHGGGGGMGGPPGGMGGGMGGGMRGAGGMGGFGGDPSRNDSISGGSGNNPMSSGMTSSSGTMRSSGTISTPHAMVRVGPPGRWWDDKKFANSIGIEEGQRKRMDTIFNQNKGPLSENFSSLQHAETQLNKLVRAKQPDETKILAQIDQVAQARADLEKSATKMLLALRRELSPEQWDKLQSRMRDAEVQQDQLDQQPQ